MLRIALDDLSWIDLWSSTPVIVVTPLETVRKSFRSRPQLADTGGVAASFFKKPRRDAAWGVRLSNLGPAGVDSQC